MEKLISLATDIKNIFFLVVTNLKDCLLCSMKLNLKNEEAQLM